MRAPETQNVEGRNPVPVTKLLVWIRTPRSDWFEAIAQPGDLGRRPAVTSWRGTDAARFKLLGDGIRS